MSEDATPIEDLRRIVEPATLGDPMRPLLWASKSHDKLAAALREMGHKISAVSVKPASADAGLRSAEQPQGRRGLETSGSRRSVRRHQRQGDREPSLRSARHFGRCEEKGTGRQLQNGGSDYRPKGDPRRVKVHYFEDKELANVVPYGVYYVAANTGFVSVGIDDTAEFAVGAVRRRLDQMGRER